MMLQSLHDTNQNALLEAKAKESCDYQRFRDCWGKAIYPALDNLGQAVWDHRLLL
jgi:hypothetical protein